MTKVTVGMLMLTVLLLMAGIVQAIETMYADFPVVATYDQRHHMRLEELPFELLDEIPHDDNGLLEDVGEYVAWYGYLVDLRDGAYYNWFLYSEGCAVHVLPYDAEPYYSWTTCPTSENDA